MSNKNGEHFSSYMKLGINHHLLFPEVFKDWNAHENTLVQVLSFREFEVIDLFLCPESPRLEREIKLIQNSKKEVVYNCPLFLDDNNLNPNSTDKDIHKATCRATLNYLQLARRIGARKIVVASGPDGGDECRQVETNRFKEYLYELCTAAKPEVKVLIEPFDRSIGKNLLVGPTREAVKLIKELREEGINNIGILIDMAHVSLLGETFEEALSLSTLYLEHIHLGNCVMKDPDSPYYGDTHPPLGIRGGENDIPELERFLRALVKVKYLNSKQRPTVTLEMRPYPDVELKTTIAILINKMEKAWQEVRAFLKTYEET